MSNVGFDELVELFEEPSGVRRDTEVTLTEASFIWRTVRSCGGVVLELDRVDGFVTSLLAAATLNHVESIGSDAVVSDNTRNFLENNTVRSKLTLRTNVSFPLFPAPFSILLLRSTSFIETLQRILVHWKNFDDAHESLILLICRNVDERCVADKLEQELLKSSSVEKLPSSGRTTLLRRVGMPYASSFLKCANAFREGGQLDLAEPLYECAIEVHPGWADVWHEFARFLLAADRDSEAESAARKAVELSGKHFHYNTLAWCLNKLCRSAEAETAANQAIDLKADYVHGWNNLGWALELQGRFAEAEAAFRTSMQLEPNYVHAHYNLGRVLITLGKLTEGYSEYESRWNLASFASPNRADPIPRWCGEPLANKSILLWAEQGVGDELTFASMIPDVVASGAKGAIECSPKLVSVFSRSFPAFDVYPKTGELHSELRNRQFDFQCPFASLAQYLRPTIDSFPLKSDYIRIDEQEQKRWKKHLNELGPGIKVGVAWRSTVTTPARKRFYLSLKELEPVLRTRGCVFVSMQYGAVREELDGFRRDTGIEIHQLRGLDLFNDIDATLAMANSLDTGVATKLSSPFIMLTLNNISVHTFGCGLIERNLGTDRLPWFPSAIDHMWTTEKGRQKVVEEIAESLDSFVQSQKN